MATTDHTVPATDPTRVVPLYVVRPLSRTPSPPAGGDGEPLRLQGPIDVPADVLYVIVENSPTELVAIWRRTSRTFFRAAASVLRLRYEALVRPFVGDVPLLDKLLREHGAIISGSVALRFFLYFETWQPADLDIYVPSHSYTDFVRDVACEDGLGFKPDGCIRPPAISSQPVRWPIREIRRFVTRTNLSVDVIRSSTGTSVTPLNGFWSTLVQNFITPDGAACGFPDATLDRRGVISPELDTPATQRAATKYEARGFTLVRDHWRIDYLPLYHRQQHYFGDRNALVLDFRRAPCAPMATLPIHPTRRSWFPSRPYPPRKASAFLSAYIPYDYTPVEHTSFHAEDSPAEALVGGRVMEEEK